MRRSLRLLALLYPKRWRERYGPELDALLEEDNPRWSDVLDITRGALEMHMKTWTFPKLAIACGLAGAIVAAAVAIRMPDRYISQAVLRVASKDEKAAGDFREEVLLRTLSRGTLAELIQRGNLYSSDRRRLPLEDLVRRMQQSISIRTIQYSPGSPGAFIIQFDYANPAQAQSTINDLVAKLIDTNLRSASATTLEVIDPPSLDPSPVAPNRLTIVVLGIALGLLLAALTTAALRFGRRAAQ
jgi:capsular polysaccharide biosynthesis protein